jgi:positive regulator of sigma E activity
VSGNTFLEGLRSSIPLIIFWVAALVALWRLVGTSAFCWIVGVVATLFVLNYIVVKHKERKSKQKATKGGL